MSNTISFRHLFEKVSAEEVHQVKLPVAETKLAPVLSAEAVHLHYNVLYKHYVEKAHAGEGEFQVAGAQLHSLFFEQFQSPQNTNIPTDEIGNLISEKFGNYTKFKDDFLEVALSIHGSGWVYLSTNGSIKTIKNHKIVEDIALLLDMWEHSFIFDYGADKTKYIKNMWKIINWDVINTRVINKN